MTTTNIQSFFGNVEVAGTLDVTGTLTSTTGVDKVSLAVDTTDASRPIIFSTGETGSQSLKTDPGITYNPSKNVLAVTSNIGIGTSAPAYTLDVNGSAGVGALTATTGTFSSNFAVNTDDLFVDTATGSVGVGLTNPSKMLHVKGEAVVGTSADNFQTQLGSLYFIRGAERNGTGLSDRHHYISTRTNGAAYGAGDNNMIFHIDDGSTTDGTSHVTPLTLTGTGNVGIGTSSPAYKLDVNGSARVGALTATSATVPNDGDFVMSGKPLQPTAGLHWDKINSRLGVGMTSPQFAVDVDGIINAKGLYLDGSAYTVSPWKLNGNDVYYTTGNVGVGTTNPSDKLHVYGAPMIQHDTRRQITTAAWYKIGTWDATASDGARLKVSLLGGTSYSALGRARGGETIIYASINNNSPTSVANIDGLVETHGKPVTNQVKFKQVGTDRTKYEIHAYILTFTQHSMSVECSGTTTFTKEWVASSDPGVESATVSHAIFSTVVDNLGNVGIGTTAPAYKLDVNGTLNSGALTATSLSVAANTDNTGIIGRAKVGNVGSDDYAGFAHYDHGTTSNYALLQGPSGETLINSATGQKIYFRENNADKMVLSGGNVGIGTTSPGAKLEVHDDGLLANSGNLVADFTGSWIRVGDARSARTFTKGMGIKFHDAGIVHYSIGQKDGIFRIAQTSSDGNTLFPGDATDKEDALCVDSSGNVGIGTTAPAYKLEVSGKVAVPNDGDFVMNSKPLTSASGLHWDTVNLRLGVGTASPSHKLHIYDASASALKIETDTGQAQVLLRAGATVRRACRIDFSRADTGTQYAWIIGDYQQNATDDLTLGTSGGGRIMTLTQGGNVGIGTTSPGYKLDVHGTSNVGALTATTGTFKENVYFSDTAANYGTSTAYNTFRVGRMNYSPSSVMNGNGGVYVSAGDLSMKAQGLNWAIAEDNEPKGAEIYLEGGRSIKGGQTHGSIYFRTAGTTHEVGSDRMVIEGDTGNVGIGTTDPSDTLHIVGNTRTTGLTYGFKLTGQLDDTKTESWYRLLKDTTGRTGSNGIRTACKLQISSSGLHETVTFDFNQMISVDQTSGCTFNLYGHDHYVGREGVLKLRLAEDSSGDRFLDMYINHDVVTVSRVWTVTLYVEGGSVASEPTTFLEKITTDPLYSIEFDIEKALSGVCNNSGQSFIFDQSGNVGIGTSSPSYKLDVNGTVNTGALTATTGTFSDDLAVGTSKLFVDVSTGNVGIGTTDPGADFHVGVGDANIRIGAINYSGSAADTTTYGLERSRNQILFSTWRDSQTDKIGAKICGINKQTYGSPSLRHLIQSTDLAFYTVPPDLGSYDDTVERLRITDAGNVGIGTTSPAYKLDVNGTVNTGALTATSATVPNDGDFVMGGKPLKPATGLHWDRTNSRLGVGTTSPGSKLHVDGQVYATGAFYTDANRSVIRGGSPTLYFRDTDQMSAMIHNNSNLLYILRGGTDTEAWSQVNGQWPWVFNLSNNDSTCGGSLYCVGNVGMGGTLTATSFKQGAQPIQMTREWTFDLRAQSTSNFYPIFLKHIDRTGVETGDYMPINFKLTGQTLVGSDAYNDETLIGVVRGGGWSDHNGYYEVSSTRFTTTEKRIQGIWEGSNNTSDHVAIYVRGGYGYTIHTDADNVFVSTSAYSFGATSNDSVFAIKNDSGGDVSGTSRALNQLVNIAGAGNFTSRKFIDGDLTTTGNVGIGTTSPAYTLDVNGTVNTGALTATTGTFSGDIILGGNVFTNSTIGLNWGSGYGIARGSGAWTSPNYAQLGVNWVTGIVLNAGGGTYGRSYVGVNDRMAIGSSYYNSDTKPPDNGLLVEGYVGIGTASPLSVLTVKSNYSGGTASGFCLDASNGTTVYNLRLSSYVQAGSQVGYKFTVNNVASTVDALNFGYNGNVGIGVTSPAAKLDSRSGVGNGSASWISGTFGGTSAYPRVVMGALSSVACIGAHNSALNAWDKIYLNDPNGQVVVDTAGRLGIGTASPGHALQVNGNMYMQGLGRQFYLDTGGAGLHWGAGYTRIVDDGNIRFCTDDTMHWNTGSTSTFYGTERMYLQNWRFVVGGTTLYVDTDDDRVGIDRIGPSYPLDVNGTCRATSFTTSSDRRIKKNIIDIDDSSALETIRLIQPKKYEYIDSKLSGTIEQVWGFIAQEVEEVMPYAVDTISDFIPNIFEWGEVVGSNVIVINTSNFLDAHPTLEIKDIRGKKHTVTIEEIVDTNTVYIKEDLSDWTGSLDEEGNVISETTTTTLTIEEYEALEDKSGYTPDISGYQKGNVILSVEEYRALKDTTGYERIIESHTKTETKYPGSQIFVNGQKVNDFKTIKKHFIWTVATAALQEVDRQLQAEKAKVATLETQLASVLARLDALESA